MKKTSTIFLAVVLLLITTLPAAAHQPYIEDLDLTRAAPFTITDISISLAYYGTLDKVGDVDYFVFAGKKNQAVFLNMVIPAITGQETFTPTVALLGPGLATISVPKPVEPPAQSGALILRAASGQPSLFYEPFGGRNYYQRQEQTIKLPTTGQYVIAIWSESGQVGRYTFSPGTREVGGGNRNYRSKIKEYWTPVQASPTATPKPK